MLLPHHQTVRGRKHYCKGTHCHGNNIGQNGENPNAALYTKHIHSTLHIQKKCMLEPEVRMRKIVCRTSSTTVVDHICSSWTVNRSSACDWNNCSEQFFATNLAWFRMVPCDSRTRRTTSGSWDVVMAPTISL
eukprot:m.103880 g.103880  ORF g.103880 m.103880 type:complete len:133 (+) comp12625_c1_seq2:657-1055(+)